MRDDFMTQTNVADTVFNRAQHMETTFAVLGKRYTSPTFIIADRQPPEPMHSVLQLDTQAFDNHTEAMSNHINEGTSTDPTIKEHAKMIKEPVGYRGQIDCNPCKPYGSLRKLINSRWLNSLGGVLSVGRRRRLAEACAHLLNNP